MKSFLVQRIKKRSSKKGKKGVDQYFEFDYMGSAEFEWGALPKALKAMKNLEGISLPITTDDGAKAYFFGPEKMFSVAEHLFKSHYSGNTQECHTKDRTEIRSSYHPQHEWDGEIIGWWDIENHFVIFKTQHDRKLWRRSLKMNLEVKNDLDKSCVKEVPATRG